jgi:hypothetical protein
VAVTAVVEAVVVIESTEITMRPTANRRPPAMVHLKAAVLVPNPLQVVIPTLLTCMLLVSYLSLSWRSFLPPSHTPHTLYISCLQALPQSDPSVRHNHTNLGLFYRRWVPELPRPLVPSSCRSAGTGRR